MPRTVSDALLEVLADWGVDTVFGLPGDGINGLMEALRAARAKFRYIHVRHEEAAAMAACAYCEFENIICKRSRKAPGTEWQPPPRRGANFASQVPAALGRGMGGCQYNSAPLIGPARGVWLSIPAPGASAGDLLLSSGLAFSECSA